MHRTQLRTLSKSFQDVQKTRIKLGNRGSQGDPVSVEIAAGAINGLVEIEQGISKAMQSEVKREFPELWEWHKDTPGLGSHLLARLLGAIGDPVIAYPQHWEENPDFNEAQPSSPENPKRVLIPDEPYERTVSQLWAYCGLGDPAIRRRRGMDQVEALACGNPDAGVVMKLIADSCLKAKATSPYGKLYDGLKEKYLAKGLTKGHAHNAALRKIKKEVLKDLWIVRKQCANHL